MVHGNDHYEHNIWWWSPCQHTYSSRGSNVSSSSILFHTLAHLTILSFGNISHHKHSMCHTIYVWSSTSLEVIYQSVNITHFIRKVKFLWWNSSKLICSSLEYLHQRIQESTLESENSGKQHGLVITNCKQST